VCEHPCLGSVLFGAAMASSIIWLDFSDDQQRKVNEALRNFETKDTVDDLGLGSVRDAISNALFPGTSVLQTRARYLLFIPWIFQEAFKKSPKQLVDKAYDLERNLIIALLNSEDVDGVIGREKGKDLKTLPSSIYWSALQMFGIFQIKGATIRQFGRIAARSRENIDYEGEFLGNDEKFWTEMPNPPEGFGKFQSADMSLTVEEAGWLCERILSVQQRTGLPSLLSELVALLQNGDGTFLEYSNLWDIELSDDADFRIQNLVRHSQFFSLLAEGISLLYNSMLIDALKAKGREFSFADDYSERLKVWEGAAIALKLDDWCSNIEIFWSCLNSLNVYPSEKSKYFVAQIAKRIEEEGLDGFSSNRKVKDLIFLREKEHKKYQARLHNSGRLFSYRGEAGTRTLNFRWPVVRRILGDVASAYGLSDH
jgi:hypothetical protein